MALATYDGREYRVLGEMTPPCDAANAYDFIGAIVGPNTYDEYGVVIAYHFAPDKWVIGRAQPIDMVRAKKRTMKGEGPMTVTEARVFGYGRG